MPPYIKDDVTADLVAKLARQKGVTKQTAVRLAVEAEINRVEPSVPL